MKKMRRKRRWPAWILSVLILLGLFPLQTLAAETENPVHAHTADCYEEILICEEEHLTHQHEEDCWQTGQVLSCQEEHDHTEDCYQEEQTLICELEEGAGGEHTADCYQEILICEEAADSQNDPGEGDSLDAALSQAQDDAPDEVQQLSEAIRLFLEKYDPDETYDEEELAQLRQDGADIRTRYEALDEEARLLVEGYDEFVKTMAAFEASEEAETKPEAVEPSPAVKALNEEIQQFLTEFDPEKQYTQEEQSALLERFEAILESYEALGEEEKAQIVGLEDILSFIQDGGGVFTVADSEAAIDGTPYATLEEAMGAAQSGDTVVLQQDVDLESYYYLKSGNSVTVDLNGHNITSQSTAFMVKAGSELTLTGSGTVSGQGYASEKAGGAVVAWGGVINLEGDVVLTSGASDLAKGGAVWIYYGAFRMNGGRIEGTHAQSGGGVYAQGYSKGYPGTFEMNGGEISGCSAEEGGAVCTEYYGVFQMNDGLITDCSANTGAGVRVGNQMVMNGGQIAGNFAEWYAAGVFVDDCASFTMTGGAIAHNRLGDENSGFPGGVFQRWDSSLTVKGGAVYDNDQGDFALCYPGTSSVIAAGKMQAENIAFTGWRIKPEYGSGERETQGALPDKMPDYYSYIYCTAIYEKGEAVYSQTVSLGGEGSQTQTFDEAKALAEQMTASAEWNGEPIVIEVGKTLNVSGDEEWTFGENAENIVVERSPSFDGYLVNVSGSLTLKDITIQGTGIGGKNHSLIKVTDGQLTIEDGTVLQNNGAGTPGPLDSISRGNYDGGAVYANGGSVTMTGGQIRGNTSEYLGGGVSINGGSFEMTGGEISENESHCGGGVSVVRGGEMLLSSGQIADNKAMIGGGICVGGRTTAESTGQSELTMKGGAISGNTAKSNGGGIYVQMNSVATVTAGEIVGNQTTNEQDLPTSHRGAGIYVNGGSGTNSGLGHEKPVGLNTGLLRLENVEITGNTASNGAGLAGCATSQIEIYVTDGAVFHGNYSTSGLRNDIELDRSVNSGTMYYISDFMLGGGMYRWYWNHPSSGQLAQPSQYQYTSNKVSLGGVCRDEDIQKAQAKATVLIANNTTNGFGPGGGIASNGAVVIGTMDESTGRVTVNKLWEDNNNQYGKRPQSIQLSLQYGDLTMNDLTLTAENQWTVTRTGLTQDILSGLAQAELTVKEVQVDGYRFQGATAQVVGNEVVITLTNQYVPQLGSLKISKTVTGNGGDRNRSFTFNLILRDGNGNQLTGQYPYTGKGSGTVSSGSSFTLKSGESVLISGLPAETTYTVTETEANRDGYTTTATGAQGTIVANETAEASFVNHRQAGSLKISKTVTGNGGDRNRSFTFNLILRDGDGNQLTGQYPYTGKGSGMVSSGSSFTLKSGESILISGLPAGTTYTVTETEANRDGYTTTATGNQGVIVANKTAEASFVNHRQAGSLKISKTVTGNGGDRNRSFTFNLILRDGDGNQLTGQYPYTGKGSGMVSSGSSFTLKSGESILISGLPAGTTYTVTETEANRDGYTTTATGNQGVIVANKTAEASFVNNRTVTPPRDPDPNPSPSPEPEPEPERPRPGRPDDDDDDDDDDPTPSRPTWTVPYRPTPTDPPTENNLVTIMDPATPLASQPVPSNNLVTILDPTMPLGNLPITGGYGLSLVLTGVALLGVAFFTRKK